LDDIGNLSSEQGGPARSLAALAIEQRIPDDAQTIAQVQKTLSRTSAIHLNAEALEERALLPLMTIKETNPAPAFPAEMTDAGGTLYFTTGAAKRDGTPTSTHPVGDRASHVYGS
jgi:hypothetical protein